MNDLLVTTAWLENHLGDDNLRIVDIRGHVIPASEPPPHYFAHRDQYEAGHIPHAVFVDWTSDIVEPGTRSYDVANPERYRALMESLGIGDETYVVAYDDAAGMFAARFWWTLQYYGHTNVAVLDGGWPKWVAEDRPVTLETPEMQTATFTLRVQSDQVYSADDIQALKPVLIDARSPAEFNGESSRARRKGRIPGAINLPRSRFVNPDGTIRSEDEINNLVVEAGLSLDSSDVAVYCNSGVSSSYVLLALRWAGLSGGRVYDGSWKDWGNDDSRPIE